MPPYPRLIFSANAPHPLTHLFYQPDYHSRAISKLQARQLSERQSNRLRLLVRRRSTRDRDHACLLHATWALHSAPGPHNASVSCQLCQATGTPGASRSWARGTLVSGRSADWQGRSGNWPPRSSWSQSLKGAESEGSGLICPGTTAFPSTWT